MSGVELTTAVLLKEPLTQECDPCDVVLVPTASLQVLSLTPSFFSMQGTCLLKLCHDS